MDANQRIKIAIGDLVIQNQSMIARIEELERENEELKKVDNVPKVNGKGNDHAGQRDVSEGNGA